MSLHIEAKEHDIADFVLMPGDPLRAKFMAEHFLENTFCYNKVRNMFGFTGMYNDRKISIQSSGMGIPSFLIYAEELIRNYKCKTLIRIGTCGSIQPDVTLTDLILVQAAHYDSNVIKKTFSPAFFSTASSYQLLCRAEQEVIKNNYSYHVGSVLTSDLFYDDAEDYMKWRKYGTLAVDMETAGLFAIASKYGVQALSILTVSDEILTNKHATKSDREKNYTSMMKCALGIVDQEK